MIVGVPPMSVSASCKTMLGVPPTAASVDADCNLRYPAVLYPCTVAVVDVRSILVPPKVAPVETQRLDAVTPAEKVCLAEKVFAAFVRATLERVTLPVALTAKSLLGKCATPVTPVVASRGAYEIAPVAPLNESTPVLLTVAALLVRLTPIPVPATTVSPVTWYAEARLTAPDATEK